MRSVSSITAAALSNAVTNGIVPRDFVFVKPVGSADTFGFYSDIDPSVSVPVIDGETGITVIRTYEGAGSIQSIDDITLAVGLDIYNVTVTLSDIHPSVNDMVRGHDLRNAKIEIHRGLYNPTSSALIDPPVLHFMGTVNLAEPTRPAVDSAGGIAITATSITNELTRLNPAKFSNATMQRRSGDNFLRYADVMGSVKLQWGANPKDGPKKK